jgi:hypothetical protein
MLTILYLLLFTFALMYALSQITNFAISEMSFDSGDNTVGFPTIHGLYIPQNWALSYFNKLSTAGTNLIKIGIISDSISLDDVSPTHSGTSFVNLMQVTLQQLYGDGGAGFIHSCHDFAKYNSRISYTGSWTASRNIVASFSNRIMSTNSVGAYVQVVGRGQTISIYHYQLFDNDQQFTVLVTRNKNNNNNTVLFSSEYKASQGTSFFTNTMVELIIGGMPIDGVEYTITITNQSPNGGSFYFAGLATYNPTGIVLFDFSVPSTQQLLDLVSTTTVTGGNSLQLTLGAVFNSIYCDLIILSLAVNDANNGNGLYAANMQTVLTQLAITQQPMMFFMPFVCCGIIDNSFLMSYRAYHEHASNQYGYAYLDLNSYNYLNIDQIINATLMPLLAPRPINITSLFCVLAECLFIS